MVSLGGTEKRDLQDPLDLLGPLDLLDPLDLQDPLDPAVEGGCLHQVGEDFLIRHCRLPDSVALNSKGQQVNCKEEQVS